MNRWDVYRAYIHFEDDTTQGKKRPILMLNVSDFQFITCKITSKYRDEELEYAIRDWRGAGLDRPSYVRLEHKVYLTPDTEMIKLGTLQKVDIDNIKILCQKYDIKLNEKYDETFSPGEILKRGDLSKYKISDEELEEIRSREMNESRSNPYFTPYGYKDAVKVLNGKAPRYYYHLKEIEMDSGDGAKLANYAKKLGLNVIQDPDSDPDYPTWYIPGEYHWDDYFYPYPYEYEDSINDKKEQGLEEDMGKLDEIYSREGYSWDEINGMIHIYEDGKLVDKYPDMKSAEEAGWDLEMLNESLDQMREKAQELRNHSDAYAILYGYKTKDGKEIDLYPEEYMDEKSYKERINQIVKSFNDYDKNKMSKESDFEFYSIYANKKQLEEEEVQENPTIDKLKNMYPTLDNTWNMGADKTKLNNEEFELLYKLTDKLAETSPNNYKYEVKLTYEDYGAGMKWYNIICTDRRGNSWQVLNTKNWLDLMNTKNVDKVYTQVVNDEYFQDKKKSLDEMNMWEMFNYSEDEE